MKTHVKIVGWENYLVLVRVYYSQWPLQKQIDSETKRLKQMHNLEGTEVTPYRSP